MDIHELSLPALRPDKPGLDGFMNILNDGTDGTSTDIPFTSLGLDPSLITSQLQSWEFGRQDERCLRPGLVSGLAEALDTGGTVALDNVGIKNDYLPTASSNPPPQYLD